MTDESSSDAREDSPRPDDEIVRSGPAQIGNGPRNTALRSASGLSEPLAGAMLEIADVGIMQVSRTGAVIYLNPRGRTILRLGEQDVTATSMQSFAARVFLEDGTPCGVDDFPVVRCLRSAQPQPPATLGLRDEAGNIVWGTVSAAPLIDPVSGEVESVVVTFLDTSGPKQAEASMRQSEERYRRLVEEAPDAIVIHRDGRMLLVNDALVRLYGGTSREEFLGRNVLDFAHPRDRELVRSRVQHEMRGLTTERVDQLNVGLDGRIVHVEVMGMPCIYEGRPAVQAILRDVTARKRAERQLRKQREILKKFFDRIPLVVAMLSADGRIKAVNREWRRLLGWSKELPLAELMVRLYPDPQERQQAADYMAVAGPGWRDFRLRASDGQLIDISWANIVLSDGTRIGIGQDVTRRKGDEESLKRNRAELEERVALRTDELSSKNAELRVEVAERRRAEAELQEKQRFLENMLETHENDRQLIAYEIHDTFLQEVIGALMFVEGFEASHQIGAAGHEQIATIARLLRRSIAEARRMISGLRPPIIDEQGIVAAVDYLVGEMNAGGMEIQFEHSMRVGRLTSVLEAAIFRIVQEALTNVRRHSQSRYAQVKLLQFDHTIRVEIRDYGIGFDSCEVAQGHHGLQGIRERTKLVGGSVTIHSAPGSGAEIAVEMPLRERQQPADSVAPPPGT